VKLFGVLLAILVALAVVLAVPLIGRRTKPAPDCVGRTVIVKGRHGDPVECVCIDGALSTCFNPGR
jgi:hypothetical protein